MKLSYDKDADALTIVFGQEKVVRDDQVSEDVRYFFYKVLMFNLLFLGVQVIGLFIDILNKSTLYRGTESTYAAGKSIFSC